MKVTLLTTSNLKSARRDSLERMVAAAAASRTDAIDVRLHLLFQNAAASDPLPPMPDFVSVTTVPTAISLSKARNRLLGSVRRDGAISSGGLVAFPDDDAWYPAGLLDRVTAAFSTAPDLDLWFCRYASDPARHPMPSGLSGRPAQVRDVIRHASSNTVFLRGSLARTLDFDETLGVGTPAGSGEDTDYAVRAFLAARRASFTDAPLIGHRDKDVALRARYYPGGLEVLARHAARSPDLRREHLRKIGVGLYLGLRGELPFRVFAKSLYNTVSAPRSQTGRAA